MIDMRLAAVKNLFFDRQAVLDAVSRAERKVLSRGGAILMRSARKSIKPVGKRVLKRLKKSRGKGGRKRVDGLVSKPGQPPLSHTGLLRNNIFFAFEPVQSSVVVGPIRLNQKISGIPAILERGGQSKVMSGGRRKRRVIRTVKVAARPYMGPALVREQSKLPPLWADSVRG